MPRLPSEADLGAAAAPRVSGGLPSYQVSGDDAVVQKATAKLGQTIENVGDAIYQIDQKLTKARQSSQLSDAVGRATGDLGELELSFDRDQDFKTAPDRFNGKAELIRQKYDAIIDDPTVKEAFMIRFRDVMTAKRLNVIKGAAKQEGDYNAAALDRNLDIYASNAANAANMAERDIIINQADIDIANMRRDGWITDVDAGNRRRAFLGKVDQAVVTRDMVADPYRAASRLSTDADYAKNIDPVLRERLIDQGFRRAETERNQRDAAMERERKKIGDEYMKQAVTHQSAGTLTPEFVERVKPWIEWREYQGLKESLKGGAKNDDPATFSMIEGLVETNPSEARRQAFLQHRNGQITNATLQSVNSRTRTIERQEGPRSPYERERAHVTQVLKPSEFVNDPAPAARYAVAVREFDDFAATGNPTAADLRAKADEVVKRYAMVDMTELARKTGLGAQRGPAEIIAANNAEARRLMEQKDAKQISERDFKKKMEALNKSSKAAEKALANGGGK